MRRWKSGGNGDEKKGKDKEMKNKSMSAYNILGEHNEKDAKRRVVKKKCGKGEGKYFSKPLGE